MGMKPYYLYRQKNIAGNFENVGYAKVDKAENIQHTYYGGKTVYRSIGAGASTKVVFSAAEDPKEERSAGKRSKIRKKD